jgi:hypothetical protein
MTNDKFINWYEQIKLDFAERKVCRRTVLLFELRSSIIEKTNSEAFKRISMLIKH